MSRPIISSSPSSVPSAPPSSNPSTLPSVATSAAAILSSHANTQSCCCCLPYSPTQSILLLLSSCRRASAIYYPHCHPLTHPSTSTSDRWTSSNTRMPCVFCSAYYTVNVCLLPVYWDTLAHHAVGTYSVLLTLLLFCCLLHTATLAVPAFPNKHSAY